MKKHSLKKMEMDTGRAVAHIRSQTSNNGKNNK